MYKGCFTDTKHEFLRNYQKKVPKMQFCAIIKKWVHMVSVTEV